MTTQSIDPLTVSLSHSVEYTEFLEAHFILLAITEELRCLRGLAWPTGSTAIDSLGEVLGEASYDFDRGRRVLTRIGSAVALLVLQHRRFIVRLAATDEVELDSAVRTLRETVPELVPSDEAQEVHIAFWRKSERGEAILCSVESPSRRGKRSSKTTPRKRVKSSTRW